MREIQASEAEIHLPSLLTEVEQGETVVITRDGRPIARLVPETEDRRARMKRLTDDLARLREKMPRLTIEEILSARDEGRRY